MIVKHDEIGPWSEVKLEIIKKYAKAYSTILTSNHLHHSYIDAFAGSGTHVSRTTGEYVAGSPTNALLVQPSFQEYHFIDLDHLKVESLRTIAGERSDVYVYEGDCNPILLKEIFPRIRYEEYRRALCLLDPYGLHLNWEVMETAGRLGTIEFFLNFPIMDMNRNILRRKPDDIEPGQAARMTAFWGDESWRTMTYDQMPTLFGPEEIKTATNDDVAEAFRNRLKKAGHFGYVPEPMPMRNSTGAIVYYLFFASQRPVAQSIVEDIFNKYRS